MGLGYKPNKNLQNQIHLIVKLCRKNFVARIKTGFTKFRQVHALILLLVILSLDNSLPYLFLLPLLAL